MGEHGVRGARARLHLDRANRRRRCRRRLELISRIVSRAPRSPVIDRPPRDTISREIDLGRASATRLGRLSGRSVSVAICGSRAGDIVSKARSQMQIQRSSGGSGPGRPLLRDRTGASARGVLLGRGRRVLSRRGCPAARRSKCSRCADRREPGVSVGTGSSRAAVGRAAGGHRHERSRKCPSRSVHLVAAITVRSRRPPGSTQRRVRAGFRLGIEKQLGCRGGRGPPAVSLGVPYL